MPAAIGDREAFPVLGAMAPYLPRTNVQQVGRSKMGGRRLVDRRPEDVLAQLGRCSTQLFLLATDQNAREIARTAAGDLTLGLGHRNPGRF